MNVSKISVIIPLYNQKEFVKDAIDSALNQTYKNIEVIVVNDGSTDHPESVLEDFKDRIIIINQKNKGLSGARNTGIKNANGVYYQFLDGDDILVEDKIEKQIEILSAEKEKLSYCKIKILDDRDKSISSRIIYDFDDIFSHYYLYWKPYPTPIHSLLFHRDIFKKYGLFEEELKANEDRYYLAKLAYMGVSFFYAPFLGGFYRMHNKSMNSNPIFIINSTIDFYLRINHFIGQDFIKNKYGYSGYQMMCANCTFFYFNNIRNGTSRKNLKHIKKIFKQEQIVFFVEPLNSRFKKNKYIKMLFACYFKRFINSLFKR